MFNQPLRVFVNQSLAEGVFQNDFKLAKVKKLRKKPLLNKECPKHMFCKKTAYLIFFLNNGHCILNIFYIYPFDHILFCILQQK